MLRNQKITGLGLIAVGVLFLLVSNRILFGWEHIWPLFAVTTGILLLRRYASRPTPETMFSAMATLLVGVFLMLFTTGILPWERMNVLWPTIPLIGGISLIAIAGPRKNATEPIVIGAAAILFAFVSFLAEGGVIGTRVATPFIRFWPLVLIIAGALVIRGHRDAAVDGSEERGETPLAGGEDEREANEVTVIAAAVTAETTPDAAIRTMVEKLKQSNDKYTWVGVYRVEGEEMTLGESDYVGMTPEHTRIKLKDGICGAAATEKRTVIVPDVRQDGRYLACSPSVRSEIVVPVLKDGETVAVLDIDSNTVDAFNTADRVFLEELVSRTARALSL